MAYERDTYKLYRHEVIAPAVRNDGRPSCYPDLLAAELAAAGFNWTAVDTVGCWEGKMEPGRQFTIFAPLESPNADTAYFYNVVWGGEDRDDIGDAPITTAEHIGHIARKIMTDQAAIQVVVDAPVNLIEA